MSRVYPKIPEFSGDEVLMDSEEEEEMEEIVVDEAYYRSPTSQRKKKTHKTNSKNSVTFSPTTVVIGRRSTPSTAASAAALASHMTPLSKYDNRPRNVEFDGENFVTSSHHRRGGQEVRENWDGSVTVSEFEESSTESRTSLPDGGSDGWPSPPEVKGHMMSARGRRGGRGDYWTVVGWLGVADRWKVVVVGCLMGLLLGVGYRGGVSLGGLFLGVSKGECSVCVCIVVFKF